MKKSHIILILGLMILIIGIYILNENLNRDDDLFLGFAVTTMGIGFILMSRIIKEK